MKGTGRGRYVGTLLALLPAALFSGCGTGPSPASKNDLLSQLSLNPSRINSGAVTVGQSSSRHVVVTNSGPNSVTVFTIAVSGAGLSVDAPSLPFTLAPAQNTHFNVIFSPAAAGSLSGRISLLSDAGNSPTVVPVTGIGINSLSLSLTPSSLSFGNTTVGAGSTQAITATNTGTGDVTVSQAAVTGNGFSTSGLTLPLILAPGQSALINIAFSPSAAGAVTGTLSLISNASGSPATVLLSGNAVTLLLATKPDSLSFGNIVLGTSSTLPLVLFNPGSSSVTISHATVTGAGFAIDGVALPLTLAPGQNSTLNVSFSPAMAGNSIGSLSIVSNAANSPASEPLNGTGVHAVVLSWAPSSSTNVVRYNIYRAAVSGGPYNKLDSLVTGANYTDQNVQAGQVYYYVATSQDATGTESPHSNEASAIIPSP